MAYTRRSMMGKTLVSLNIES